MNRRKKRRLEMLRRKEAFESPANDARPRKRISGKEAAIWLSLGFLFFAFVIPIGLELPWWVEAECVLGAWWLIWLVAITAVLYHGRFLTDDYRYASMIPQSMQPKKEEYTGKLTDGEMAQARYRAPARFDLPSGEGCVAILTILVVIVVALWALFDFVLPSMLFSLYLTTRGMLARVTNVRHRCRGQFAASFHRGFLWATAYTAPLAAAVWMLQRLDHR